MKFTRRNLLRGSAAGGALLALRPKVAWADLGSPPAFSKFVQALPGLGPTGIPVAVPQVINEFGRQVDFYEIQAGEFRQAVHPDHPGSGARFWGYADVTGGKTANHRYLGGAIVANEGRPVKLRVKNSLPGPYNHPVPVDRSIPGTDMGEPDNRITVHLHGGLVAWNSDGGPFSWFNPNAASTGASFQNAGPNGTAEYWYPNDQSARLVWYHDHALGITRLNAYAGLASAYIIRDQAEARLLASKLLPTAEIPLVIQDKSFILGEVPADYPVTGAQTGDLFYPFVYEPDPSIPGLPSPSLVPEFFSDNILVNGAAFPFVTVEQRHYRFRILNGSQSRFFNLQLYFAKGPDGVAATQADVNNAGPAFVQVGTEGGFLPFPVLLNAPPLPFGADLLGNPVQFNLLLAPAERADLVIDFTNVPAGSKLILYNDAPAPFPNGDPAVDYQDIGNGKGPDTRNLLQFQVVPAVGAKDPVQLGILESIARGLNNARVLPPISALDPKKAVTVRNLTLNEATDSFGRLLQLLGTAANGPLTYEDTATETPKAGTVEVWNIYNISADTHPIHFHLVNVQVLSRRGFLNDPDNPTDVSNPANIVWTGPARPADKNEQGWKETVRMNPGELTTVIAKFDLPKVPFNIPLSNRTGGHEYVWHCHILEHEEHDMMRPLIVQP
jgi:spore coat protein A